LNIDLDCGSNSLYVFVMSATQKTNRIVSLFWILILFFLSVSGCGHLIQVAQNPLEVQSIDGSLDKKDLRIAVIRTENLAKQLPATIDDTFDTRLAEAIIKTIANSAAVIYQHVEVVQNREQIAPFDAVLIPENPFMEARYDNRGRLFVTMTLEIRVVGKEGRERGLLLEVEGITKGRPAKEITIGEAKVGVVGGVITGKDGFARAVNAALFEMGIAAIPKIDKAVEKVLEKEATATP